MSDYPLRYDYLDNIGGTINAMREYQERCRIVQNMCIYDNWPRLDAIKRLEECDWDEIKARSLCTS